MRVVIRAAPRARSEAEGWTAPQFQLLPGRQPSFLLSLAASMFFHGVVLEMTPGLLLSIEYWRFRAPEVERMVAGKARTMPLLVRAPEIPEEKLYFLPLRPKAESGGRGPRQAAAPARVERASAPEQPAAAAAPSALVLQPGRSAEPPKKLPELKAMAVWSGPNPRQVEEPILPGAREPGLEPAPAGTSVRLEAPVPAPPKLPAALAPSAAMERARIYLPPSGSSPIASRRQWLQEPDVQFSAANVGTPAAFLILTPERPKPGETLTVPPGNIVVLGSGAGQGTAQSAASPEAHRAQASTAGVASAGGEARVAKLEGGPAREGGAGSPTAGEGGAAAGGPKPQAGEEIRAAAGASGAAAAPAGAASNRSASTSRTIHTATGDIFALVEGDGSVTLTYPVGGSFDVVVVDAALPQPISSHASALSGSPVYTAYLNVGQPVEWILHYCLPGGEAGARRQHSVVTLSAPKPLKAPYVVEAHLPPEPLWRWPGYQVFHALLTAAGRLERVRALQAGGAAGVLLDSLRRWTFRPALLDGAPAATEVLLVIPPFKP